MIHRKEYEGAKHQLSKGEDWFRNTLSPIVGLQNWKYVGLYKYFTESGKQGCFGEKWNPH